MALEALLARLEGRTVTSVTADSATGVTPKRAPMLPCTPVTAVTAGETIREAFDRVAPLPDPAAESRRQRVLAMLADNADLRIAVVCDGDGDPVPAAVAIRGWATYELRIPRAKYDPFLLLDLIARHGATMH